MNPTPASGYTPQGQSVQSLQQVLSQISGMAQQSQQDPSTAVQNQFTTAANAAQPGQIQQATQQLTQQSGIPALQGQQQNLGQIFGLYLADQNLASKYANPSLATANSPIYGNNSLTPQQGANSMGINDPYLSSPAALVNAIMGNQTQGQGFQGFTTPGQNTAAISAVPSSAASLIGTLQGAINSQQGLVNTGVSNYTNQYQTIMDTLGSILGNQAATSFSQAQPGSAVSVQSSLNNVKKDVNSGMTFTDLLQKYETDPNMTAAKLQEMYDAKHSASGDKWGPAQISPELASAYGLKQTPSQYQQKTLYKGTPYETIVNYNSKTGKMTDPNTGEPVQYTDATTRSVESSLNNIDDIWNQWNKLDEVQKHLPDSLVTAMPALSPTRAALNTQFYTGLEGDLRKAIVGGRITQQEISWIKNAIIPTATDSDASAKAKLDAVTKALKSKLQDPNIDLTQTKLPGGASDSGKTIQIGKYQVSY